MSTDTATSLRRLDLRAVERTMSWRPDACFKIVHTMLLKGSPATIDVFIKQLPRALQLTFNRHPRMRGRMASDASATLEIHPHFTLQDMDTHKLLQITSVPANHTTDDNSAWQSYVQQQCNIPFDRVNDYTFQLHAWVDTAGSNTASAVRVFLFSDHFNSDGVTGSVILNDVLRFASMLTSSESESESDSDKIKEASAELPLEPSLYDCMLASRKVLRPVLKGLTKTVARMAVKNPPLFTPLIAPREGHQDLCMPPPINQTTQLFATGSKTNLKLLMERCRQQKTTFFGVLTAAIVTAYAAVSEAPLTKPLPLSVTASLNMRERATVPIRSDTVGAYMNTAAMAQLNNKLALDSRAFWQLARDARSEAQAIASNATMTGLRLMVMDQFFHAGRKPSFWSKIHMRHASSAEVNVSSGGKYGHPMTHSFGDAGELAVASFHQNSKVPFLGTLSQFYVTSVPSSASSDAGIGYSMSHCLEDAVGQRLLDTVLQLMEHHDKFIKDTDSVADVVKTLTAN